MYEEWLKVSSKRIGKTGLMSPRILKCHEAVKSDPTSRENRLKKIVEFLRKKGPCLASKIPHKHDTTLYNDLAHLFHIGAVFHLSDRRWGTTVTNCLPYDFAFADLLTRWWNTYGRYPTYEEMARKFGIPPDKLELMPDLWSAAARTGAVLRHETPTESPQGSPLRVKHPSRLDTLLDEVHALRFSFSSSSRGCLRA
jgi:hypothetical protein